MEERFKKMVETRKKKGSYKTVSTSYKKGNVPWNKGKENLKIKGDKHPLWKGGRIKHQRGYILIHYPNHPNATRDGYVFEHRLVMEKYLKRYLEPSEVIHHIDKDLTNNDIKNLKLFSNNSEHLKYEWKKKKEVTVKQLSHNL